MRVEENSNHKIDNYQEFIDEKNYWLKKLEGVRAASYIHTDFESLYCEKNTIKLNEYILTDDISKGIKKLGNNSKYASFIIILSAIMILLKKYTDDEDILIGIPKFSEGNSSDRGENPLPVRCGIGRDDTFKDLLIKIKNVIEEAENNSNCPYQTIIYPLVEQLKCSSEKLFKVIAAMSDADSIYPSIYSGILFTVSENDEHIAISVHFNTREYETTTIDRLIKHLSKIMSAIIGNTNNPIDTLQIIEEQERKRILHDFSSNADIEFLEGNIINLFEQQVKQNPDQKAVVFNNESLTYSQLDSKSNQIANLLKQKGVDRNDIVALLLDRSSSMIVAIIGVLKAGAAYLPIDVQNPEDRIKFIIDDSKAKLIISQKDILDKFNPQIDAIDIYSGSIYETDDRKSEAVIMPEDLAYVIYTSGTSGEPKGSMIMHRNVVNLVFGLTKHIYKKYDKRLNVALIASYAFDASVQQIFAPLLGGHTLFIAADEVKMDSEKLENFYRDNFIDISDGTPTHIRILAYGETNCTAKLGVKHFIIGGEPLNCEVTKDLYNKFSEDSFAITNIYGLTECCVDSTVFTFQCDSRLDYSVVPIGVPMANQRVYILDNELNVVPPGVNGNIYIGGEGVGKGYLNRPDLNEKLFVSDIMNPQQSMFNTGDLGRWTNDGNIRIAGRKDHQVKINGYRIEIEEIERVLALYELISEAVVIVREGEDAQDKFLCAFIVQEGTMVEDNIRSYLKNKLPYYMIPKHFIQLKKIPVNQSFKVDRGYLGKLDIKAFTSTRFVAPRNEVEQTIADIWKETLKIDKVGIYDNFFNLGGDSVKAVLVLGKMKKKKLVVEVRSFFENASISDIIPYIKALDTSDKKADKGVENVVQNSCSPEELDNIMKEISNIEV